MSTPIPEVPSPPPSTLNPSAAPQGRGESRHISRRVVASEFLGLGLRVVASDLPDIAGLNKEFKDGLETSSSIAVTSRGFVDRGLPTLREL